MEKRETDEASPAMLPKMRRPNVGKFAETLFRLHLPLLCAGGLWLSAAGRAAADDCNVPHFHLCDNCETQAPAHVGKDTKCVIHFKMPGGFSAMKITKPASHGIAGIDQINRPQEGKPSDVAQVIYIPQNGYSGPDSFSMHVEYSRQSNNYSSTLNFNVDVVDRAATTEIGHHLDILGSGVEITMSWIGVTKEISPNPDLYRNSWSRVLRLSRSNQVGVVSFQNGEKYGGGDGVLGSAIDYKVAHPFCATRVDIANGGLTITDDCPSHQILTRIKTDGRTSCVATREYRLKAGHRLFEYADNNQNVHSASDQHSENVRCAIAARE